MAAHVAEQIVAGLATALAGLTTTGANVFDDLDYAVQPNQLPCLLVDQGDESSTGETVVDELLERVMAIEIAIKVKQSSGLRTTVNLIRKEIEIRLAANQTVGGAKYVLPVAFSLDRSGEGDEPIAAATMRLEARYYTRLGAPDAAV